VISHGHTLISTLASVLSFASPPIASAAPDNHSDTEDNAGVCEAPRTEAPSTTLMQRPTVIRRQESLKIGFIA